MQLGLLAMDTIFGANQEMLQGLGMCFESSKATPDNLRNSQLHGEATFARAALAEDTGELSHDDDPLP